MRHTPFEIVLDEGAHRAFDAFCAGVGIRTLYYSPDGEVLQTGMKRADSRYCRLVQKRLFGSEGECLALDARMREEARRSGRPLCYHCHAGLIEAVTPVFVDGQMLGFAMLGQIRATRRPPRAIVGQWKRLGLCAKTLEAAFAELPLHTEEDTRRLVALLNILVEQLVSLRQITLRRNLLMERVLNYLGTRLDEPVTLAEAARAIHRSPSTVTHLFRRELGQSFKRTLVEMKLNRAEALMREQPEAPIAEIARRIGYEDSFHFSRMYRKYRGRSPSAYRRRFLADASSRPASGKSRPRRDDNQKKLCVAPVNQRQ